ncbi:Phosphatidyl-N-methylethanolamine N-methyltransferase [Orbilia brochopaga]|uniref:Phosphatidyl-N-methylethanolamine N-methyltransferase n=1 Tax=Orbilia brochopaga TaxID=3140254 RepID=A0AAV9UNB5_9PEZI
MMAKDEVELFFHVRAATELGEENSRLRAATTHTTATLASCELTLYYNLCNVILPQQLPQPFDERHHHIDITFYISPEAVSLILSSNSPLSNITMDVLREKLWPSAAAKPLPFASSSPAEWVDFSQQSLAIAIASILFNPVFWNIAARSEYHYKVITKLAFGNPYYGCYLLAITIFSIGIFRDALYENALRDQPSLDILTTTGAKTLAAILFAAGNILVISSMWALGLTGTYLGDYFGILMDHKVESFPFNVTSAPMYYGSTLSFLGTAIWFGKPAGVLLTVEVLVVYLAALRFEDPFTSEIYARRRRQRAVEAKKAR